MLGIGKDASGGKPGAYVIGDCGRPVFAAFFMAVIRRFQTPFPMATDALDGQRCRYFDSLGRRIPSDLSQIQSTTDGWALYC